MSKTLQETMLRYLALSQLENELREERSLDYELRNEVAGQRMQCREIIEADLIGRAGKR